MRPAGDWFFDEGPLYMIGTAHSVSQDGEDEDPAAQVRKVAEEVSGKSIPKQVRRQIGFVWERE